MKNERDERKQKNEQNTPLSTAYNVFVGNIENEEDFEPVMDRVVNIFRRIDDKSEVSYKFGLNRE